MVDVADLPATTAVTAANFNFWTSSNGTNWVAGPAPQGITVRPLSATGDGTVDRVTVIWPDGAIVDEWLQVLFNPYPTAPLPFGFDLFLFGNLRGETGDSHNTEMLRVSALDLAGLRAALPTDPAAIDNRFDFNRDRKVTALDLALVRRSLFHQLPLITAPTPPAAPGPSSLASVREEVLGGPG